MKKTCNINGCIDFSVSFGWCDKHYRRWKRYGDPAKTPPSFLRTADERFWSKVNKDGPLSVYCPELGQCWMWTGCRSKRQGQEYGRFGLNGKVVLVHRFAFGLDAGELDHLCRNPSCVRPSHLREVTHRENVRNSNVGVKLKSRTHCLHGHEYTNVNTYYAKNGSRVCRACKLDWYHKHSKKTHI
jgi:hypothetical protein